MAYKIKVYDKNICYAVKIRAPNDPSGNPRRGWLVYGKRGGYKGFVDEGYSGFHALFKRFPKVVETASIPVAYAVYKDGMKDELV